jgi:hypothetical protein
MNIVLLLSLLEKEKVSIQIASKMKMMKEIKIGIFLGFQV